MNLNFRAGVEQDFEEREQLLTDIVERTEAHESLAHSAAALKKADDIKSAAFRDLALKRLSEKRSNLAFQFVTFLF